MDADGNPQHAGDMRGQINMALDNLEAVLTGAEMTLANIVRLNIYTIDVDQALMHFEVMGTRLSSAGVTPAMTLLGVTRLAFPRPHDRNRGDRGRLIQIISWDWRVQWPPSDARAGAILGQCRRADFEQLCRRSAFAGTGITRLPPAALSLIEAAPA